MSIAIQAPNRNAELYRDYQATNKEFTNFDFIHIHPDGSTVVGASDLTGRCWDGLLQISTSPREFLSNNDSQNTVKLVLDTSLTDGKFMSDPSKLLIGDDNGNLRLWSRQPCWGDSATKEKDVWYIRSEFIDHDDAILGLDLFPNEGMAITGGADNCIKIWDLENNTSIETFRPAHTHIVSDIACNPTLQNVFLSSSLDGSVALWHYKGTEKKAKVFGVMQNAARCVCWLSENIFATGYDNGEIILYECRQEIDPIVFGVKLDFPIHRLEFNREAKLLAVCGDSNIVTVYEYHDSTNLHLLYQDYSHREHVRGLSWDPSNMGVLYSSGWDQKVIHHHVLK